jgi:hypothetical protein
MPISGSAACSMVAPPVIWIRLGNCSRMRIATLLWERYPDVKAFLSADEPSFALLDAAGDPDAHDVIHNRAGRVAAEPWRWRTCRRRYRLTVRGSPECRDESRHGTHRCVRHAGLPLPNLHIPVHRQIRITIELFAGRRPAYLQPVHSSRRPQPQDLARIAG